MSINNRLQLVGLRTLRLPDGAPTLSFYRGFQVTWETPSATPIEPIAAQTMALRSAAVSGTAVESEGESPSLCDDAVLLQHPKLRAVARFCGK